MVEFRQIFIITLSQFFDHDFASAHTWQGDTLNFNSLEEQGNHSGAILGFKTKKGEKIIVRIASSFISPDQAMLNLTREAGTKDFETIKKRGKTPGINCSDAVNVEGGTPDQQRTFLFMSLQDAAISPPVFRNK